MKPVEKGPSPQRFSDYRDAKPHLIDRLGPHCSYCEAYGVPTALDVEHIYPKDPHPRHENSWDNFLIACKSCNSKKNSYLGSGRQRALRGRFLWPHVDNTARAFQYSSDGSVAPAPGLAADLRKLAEGTINMVGAMVDPAKAKDYDQLAIAYSAASHREEIWREVQSIRKDYLKNPGSARARVFAAIAVRMGYFSIWMEVFSDRPEFRRELISAFKADPTCFDHGTGPVAKGRI